jgi:hypothetical protein
MPAFRKYAVAVALATSLLAGSTGQPFKHDNFSIVRIKGGGGGGSRANCVFSKCFDTCTQRMGGGFQTFKTCSRRCANRGCT